MAEGAGLSGLADIVSALREIRSQSHFTRYGGGPLPDLPSRSALVEAIDGVVAALFPRHYGPSGLTGETLDAFVTLALVRAAQTLQAQVRLELELLGARCGEAVDAGLRAKTIVGRFAGLLPQIRLLLESDIRAAYEGDPAAGSLDEVMSSYPGVTAVIRHRLAHGLYRLGAPMSARVISEVAHSLTGIDIHPGAQIGESFFIDHGTGVVIGETAVIGKRCRLYQGVTLGARRFEVAADGSLAKDYPRHPILEDDVVVYAGASILGRITVGRGSTIAGNVWLTDSVPAQSRVSQVKARSEQDFDYGAGI
jgi:serine O-acetyltransferase